MHLFTQLIKPAGPLNFLFLKVSGILILFSILSACNHPNPDRMKNAGRIVERQDRLYVSYVDSALGVNSDQFLHQLDNLLAVADSSSERGMAYRRFLLGYQSYKKGDPFRAAAYYSSMLKKGARDTALYADLVTLQQCGLLQIKMDSSINDGTFRLLLPVLELNESHPSRYRWWAYFMAARACYKIGDLDKADFYAMLAAKSVPDPSDKRQRTMFLSQQSTIAARRGDFNTAMRLQDSVTALAQNTGDKKMLAASKAAKALLYIKLGDTTEGYRLQLEAHQEKKSLGMPGEISECLNMAITFLNEKNYHRSSSFAHEALALAANKNDQENLWRAGQVLYNAFYEQKDYDSAFYYYALSHEARVRQIEEQKAKEYSSLKLKYDLDQQKAHNSRLSAEKKSKDNQNRMIIGGFSAAILLAAFAVRANFRQKKLRSEKDKLKAEKEKAELEQRLLRSQMDPHFVYNSLFAVQDVIRKDKKQEAINFLSDFADLLRISLHNSRQPFSLLHDEVKALESYLRLQSLRMEDLFIYQLRLYDGYEDDFDLVIPPMLIQPFVENAIYHGMKNLGQKGEVTVTIEKSGEVLHCIIEDNGNGLRNHPGFSKGNYLSTTITRERLQKLDMEFGRCSDLKIVDKKQAGQGQGVLVELDIPFLIEQD